MTGIKKIDIDQPVSIAPLISFRIAFGAMMLFSILRFWWRGWIHTLYIEPRFHFTYMGFDWVHPLPAAGMYPVFGVMVVSCALILLGLFYRMAMAAFFLCFTYIELIDVTTYLNHYYFISLVSFIMIWLPANKFYALDVRRDPSKRTEWVPAWTIGILRFQLAIVYVFAGLAKLNPDWLLHAEPMRTWLPAKSHLPVVGKYMYQEWVAYLFSWFGAAYDLFIAFFLLNRKTRPVAYFFVLVFHLATALFFPGIGMFPYIMIISSLIFFSGDFHKKWLSRLPFFKTTDHHSPQLKQYVLHTKKIRVYAIALYVTIQLIVPFRYLAYPDHLFWSEEGYRFSWRVMLMEKSGAAYFTVKDKEGRQSFEVNNAEFLTPLQEKMMSTQPDLILRYAHYLAKKYTAVVKDPAVYAAIYVSLNGERSRLFVDSTVNLAAEPLSWKHYKWIISYNKRND